jgi:hypothetical protein
MWAVVWCCNGLSTLLFWNLLQGFINLKSGKSAFYLKKLQNLNSGMMPTVAMNSAA